MTAVKSPTEGTENRLWKRAQQYIVAGQHAAARAALEALLVRLPDNVQARLLLSSVCLAQQHLRNACEQLLIAARLPIADPEALATVAYCLHQVGEMAAMRDCLVRPEVALLRSGPLLARLAHMHQLLGQHRQALAMMDRARECGVNGAEFRYYRALQLQFNGRIEEARNELEACLREGPAIGRATLALARMRRQTPESNHLEYIDAQLACVVRGSEDHASFEFARFKELDDLDRREEAWAALERGNAVMFGRVGDDVAREHAQHEMLKRVCTEGFVTQGPDAEPEGPAPIFIVGMPRSGTTLMERILGNHSQIEPAGELVDFSRQMHWVADVYSKTLIDDALLERAAGLDYAEVGRRYLEQSQWRAARKPFFTDKLPGNFLLAGFIHRALPRARILHMVRDPMDVCFSNWKALFGETYGYSYSMGTLAGHYRRYRSLMTHWHAVMPGTILDVPYAELVRDPVRVTSRVLAFCGLPDEPRCSDIVSNHAPVATLSTAQVREPIHRHGLQAWRRYSSGMQPLHDMLGNLVAA